MLNELDNNRDTHTQNLVRIIIQLQQWLPERASVLS